MLRAIRGPHATLTTALILVSALALSACDSAGNQWDAQTLAATVENAPFQPIIVNSNLGMGPNRFALALFDQNQEFVNTADVTATFYHLDKEPAGEPTNPQRVSEATLVARTLKSIGVERADSTLVSRLPAGPSPEPVDAHIGHDSTVFAALVDFDRAGFWGISLDVKAGGQEYRGLRVVFAVQDRTLEPQVGEQAPATKQLTLTDVKSIDEIDTSTTPNPELHRLTVAQAITSGKPSVVAFVTPAFCQTRFCGPTLDQVVVPAWSEFKDRINVLHIEPYDVAKAKGGSLEITAAVQEWKLLAEPIVFVIDAGGVITAKFEGIMDYPELRDAILASLSK